MTAFRTLTRPRTDLHVGLAAGLATGGYFASAPLLGGPVGMPGEAVRYLLPTGVLLAAIVGAVLPWRGRARLRASRISARYATAACVLAGIAPLTGSPVVFASLLVVASGLGGGALGLYRPGHSWHAAFLTGAGAAATVTALFVQRPHLGCSLMCTFAALLLLPACRGTGPDGIAACAPVLRAPAMAVGAAVFGSLFAAPSLVVFRWELLGASGVRPLAYAALLAAALTSGLWAAAGRGPAADARVLPPLFAAGLTAAVVACASAARPWQLTLALAAVLTCGAAATSCTGSAGMRTGEHTRATRYPAALLFGGALAMTAIAFSGRLLGGPDTLAALGAAPAVVALVQRTRLRRGQDTKPYEDHGAGADNLVLTARALGVQRSGAPPVRRFDLALPPAEVAYLTDALPGRRAAAVLEVFAGLRKATGGSWQLRGHDISRMSTEARWNLRLSVFVDPADATRWGALHRGHPAARLTEAVAAAIARTGSSQKTELAAAAVAAFPFLAAKGPGTLRDLDVGERCLLGLAQTLMVEPALLLLDLTGPGCEQLADDPAVTAVLRHITGRGTAVLVAVPATHSSPVPRRVVLPAPGGSRAPLLRRTRRNMP
ncbi:hypothetical protein ACFYYB_27355 [Streptomyces sp. NPDC002886]|uniref:hypothetical protein n=1 Tax=Streptomyces sp. NPDC002886 TaxID=3364667 RepID=UPI0036942AA0